MGTYAIDSSRQQLVATGIPAEPILEWVEDTATGRRRPTDVQASDDRGMPLWNVEVQYVTENWGRLATAVAKVVVPSEQEPKIQPFQPVPFDGLSVTVSPTKGGGVRESWTAEGIHQGQRRTENAAA